MAFHPFSFKFNEIVQQLTKIALHQNIVHLIFIKMPIFKGWNVIPRKKLFIFFLALKIVGRRYPRGTCCWTMAEEPIDKRPPLVRDSTIVFPKQGNRPGTGYSHIPGARPPLKTAPPASSYQA
jgi:hypothetical protein